MNTKIYEMLKDGSCVFIDSKPYQVNYEVAKAIAELQEKLDNAYLKIQEYDKNWRAEQNKVHRRNLQIADLKIKVKNLEGELWNTANELAAVKIQAGLTVNQ